MMFFVEVIEAKHHTEIGKGFDFQYLVLAHMDREALHLLSNQNLNYLQSNK